MEKKEILKECEDRFLTYRFEELSEELQNDPDIILAYMKFWPDSIYEMKKDFFTSNRENMKKLLQTNISVCKLDSDVKEDPELMKLAIIYNPINIRYVKDKSTIDRDLALYAVRKFYFLLEDLGEFYQDDEEVVIAAIKKDKYAIKYASRRLQFQLQNMIYDETMDIDTILLQSSLNSIKIKTEKLRALQYQIENMFSEIRTLTTEIEQDMENVKVKKKK